MAFYPEETGKLGENFARDLCKAAKEKTVFDYTEFKMKDYHCYDYGNNKVLVVDKNYRKVKVSGFNDKARMIISDYLRYTMKADGREAAYTSDFMEKTYYKNINKADFKYDFNRESIICSFEKYNVKFEIPLKYIAGELGLKFGVKKEDYVKPVYVDPKRPIVAMTFDDGPRADEAKTNKLLDELYKYDATATFYVVGNGINDRTIPIMKKGISYGNQYGSHSKTHANLVKLNEDQIKSEVMSVSDFFQEQLNYTMTTYRPPYGSYNARVDQVIPLAAVLWDVDSSDWKLKDAKAVADNVLKHTKNGSVVLLHDIHDTSVQAMVEEKVIKNLIDQGYQLVTINELAEIKGVELKQGVHLCWDK